MKLPLVMSESFLEWYENHPEELQKTIRRIATLPVPQSAGLSKLWCLQCWSNWDFISREENAALVVFAARHPDLLCDSELAQKCINAVDEMQGTALRMLQIDSAEQSVAAVNRTVQDNPLRLPPQAPSCRPHSAQSQLARVRAVGLVTCPHARNPPHPQPVGSGPRQPAQRAGSRGWESA